MGALEVTSNVKLARREKDRRLKNGINVSPGIPSLPILTYALPKNTNGTKENRGHHLEED